MQSLPSSYVSFSLIKKGINKVILHVCEKSGRRAQDSIIDIWSLNTIMGFEQFKIYIKQLATVNHEDCHFKFRSRKRSKRILCFPLWRWKWEYIITICKFNELYDKILVNIRGGSFWYGNPLTHKMLGLNREYICYNTWWNSLVIIGFFLISLLTLNPNM